MDIEFENLTYKVNRTLFNFKGNERTILKSVNGRFMAGSLSGILGPSGAGKTCLLNAISGYRLKKYKMFLVYTNVEERRRIFCLEGKKKRLSIALELINNPPVLFLDEPTSGLDNVSTTNLLKLLRTLAHQGRTIVCTIHQPSATMFMMFDQVYVLASGLCVYQGATRELVPFLSDQGFNCPTTYNPADFVIELTENEENISKLSKATGNGKVARFDSIKIVNDRKDDCAIEHFNHSRLGDDYDKKLCARLPVSCWIQFVTLLSRMILQLKRNKLGLQIQFGNTLLCGLAFGVLFYKMARDGDQFFAHMKFCIGIIIFHTYTMCMAPVLAYPFEVKLLKKELFNQWYGLIPYYTALTFSRVPTNVFFNMIYLTIVYTLSGLPLEVERFFCFCAVGLMTSFIAEAMGLAIGSVFNVTNGAAVGPLSLAPFLGLAIYGFDFARSIPRYMKYVVDLSFIRTGANALILTIFGLNREKLDCTDPVYCHFQNPQVTLYTLDLDSLTVWSELLNLFIKLIVFRMIFFLALKWRLRS